MKDIKLPNPEELARKIPGFTGYQECNERRDADRLQRETLARGVIALKARVQDIQEELLNAGDMKLMGRLGETNNRLDRIADRLRHSNQGYSGFYDAQQIDATLLTAIYEYDLTLHNDLDRAQAALAALKENPAELEQGLQEFDAKLDARERMLRGVS